MIKTLLIKGYRGFGSNDTELNFSIPNGTIHSGLNIIVGQNNSGKSTIIESMKYFANRREKISFSGSKRNQLNDDRVLIKIVDENDSVSTIETISTGGSEAIKTPIDNKNIIYIPSRRGFNKSFSKNPWNIENIQRDSNLINKSDRQVEYNEFTYLFEELVKNRDEFQKVLKKLTDFPEWTIDLDESGQYFLKVYKNKYYHTSEGMGDGLISLMTLVGTLVLSKPNSTILIDEPELSLHPDVLKKLFILLKNYSTDRQIILSTHSPYFVDIESIADGAKIYRVVNTDNLTRCYELSNESISFFKSVLRDYQFPHAVGLDTREIFFMGENIIVVEGQEDVVGYNRGLQETTKQQFNFYGWGAGGASNITKVIRVLQDLGFNKIAAIYDGDKKAEYEKAKSNYPNLHFEIINKDDIRDKLNDNGEISKEGLLDKKFNLKNEYKEEFIEMFNRIAKYFNIQY